LSGDPVVKYIAPDGNEYVIRYLDSGKQRKVTPTSYASQNTNYYIDYYPPTE
jgi:hypothetical protein